MSTRARETAIPVAGVPDGLCAHALQATRRAADGTLVEVRDRRGRPKPVTRVVLRPATVPAKPHIDGLPESERTVAASVRTSSYQVLERRLGSDAWHTVLAWIRRGLIEVECEVDDMLRLGLPRRVLATPQWRHLVEQETARRTETLRAAAEQLAKLAATVQELSLELADALRAQRDPSSRVTAALMAVGEDLLDGARHSSPRAFSQTHFGDTKYADDVASILAAHNVPDSVSAAIGVERTPRVGLAGPLVIHTADGPPIDLTPLSGPTVMRCAPGDWRLTLARPVPLLIVENLQAAEAICDRHPDLALVYCAGMPSTGVLEIAASLGAQATHATILCDADLGGVRIADRLATALPDARIADPGTVPHTSAPPWPADGASVAGLKTFATGGGPAAALATACLHRGYPVEQEQPIIELAQRVQAR